MRLVDLATPGAGDGEVLIRVTRAGINFADTHQTENNYVAKFELPLIPGGEVAGVVERDGGGFAPASAWWRRPGRAATPSTWPRRPPRPSRSPTASTTTWRWRCSSRA